MRQKWEMGKFWAGVVGVLLVMALAVPAHATYSIKQIWARVAGVAGETLTTGDLVAVAAADGKIYKADADLSTRRPAIGIIGNGGASGANVEIVMIGRVSGWSSLTKGALGYTSGTAAAVTQSAPGWNQSVGVALSATDYFFNFSNYFDTSALTITQLGTLTTDVVLGGTSYATTVTKTEPTAARTATIPDASGTVGLLSAASHSYSAGHADWTLSTNESQATVITVTSADAAVNAIKPAATAGKCHMIYNNSGQTLTFKVTGQTGGTIATGKKAFYCDNGTDVVELYEQP